METPGERTGKALAVGREERVSKGKETVGFVPFGGAGVIDGLKRFLVRSVLPSASVPGHRIIDDFRCSVCHRHC
jgi:hypothetical protein